MQMETVMRTKAHPGVVLKHEFMKPQELEIQELATALNIPAPRLSAILEEKASIDVGLAAKLAAYFGTSPSFWLNLQAQYDAAHL